MPFIPSKAVTTWDFSSCPWVYKLEDKDRQADGDAIGSMCLSLNSSLRILESLVDKLQFDQEKLEIAKGIATERKRLNVEVNDFSKMLASMILSTLLVKPSSATVQAEAAACMRFLTGTIKFQRKELPKTLLRKLEELEVKTSFEDVSAPIPMSVASISESTSKPQPKKKLLKKNVG
jgi:hypothetical protein